MTTKFPLQKIFRAKMGDAGAIPRFDVTELFAEDAAVDDVPLSVPVRPPFPQLWLEQETVSQAGNRFFLAAWVQEIENGVAIRCFGKDSANGFYSVPFVHHLTVDDAWVVDLSVTYPEPDSFQKYLHEIFGDAYETTPEDELWDALEVMHKYQQGDKHQARFFWDISQDLSLSAPVRRRYQQLAFFAGMVGKSDFTLRLMNVKNIEVVDAGGDERKRHRHRRHGRVERSYTLRIRPGSFRNSRGETQHAGAKNAYHIARGHFKTYTEDAPLLGKYIGTWWWPAHARGSKTTGTVTKDYEVHPPRSGEVGDDD